MLSYRNEVSAGLWFPSSTSTSGGHSWQAAACHSDTQTPEDQVRWTGCAVRDSRCYTAIFTWMAAGSRASGPEGMEGTSSGKKMLVTEQQQCPEGQSPGALQLRGEADAFEQEPGRSCGWRALDSRWRGPRRSGSAPRGLVTEVSRNCPPRRLWSFSGQRREGRLGLCWPS